MVRSISRRLGIFVLSLLGASILIFVVAQLLPGDVARVIAGDGASEEMVAATRTQLGLDRPAFVRYLEWVAGMLHGDFGNSYISGQPVLASIMPTLGVTAWLVSLALVLAVVIALPLGMLAAIRRRNLDGMLVSASAQVGMAIPAFWAGIMLTLFFAVTLHWLPPNRYIPLTRNPYEWARHLVLPVVSLGVIQAAVLIRYVRSAFIEVLHEDYYRTARSLGWRRFPALVRHGVRNAALSLVTVLGLQLASVLVGAIVIEKVFVLPGLGSQLLFAVSQSDLIMIQGIVMLLVVAVLVINAIVDISYVLIDPRIRVGEDA